LPTSGEPTILAHEEHLYVKTREGIVKLNLLGETVKKLPLPGLDLEAIYQSNCLVDKSENFWFSFYRELDEEIPNHPYGLYRWDAALDSLVHALEYPPQILAMQKIGAFFNGDQLE